MPLDALDNIDESGETGLIITPTIAPVTNLSMLGLNNAVIHQGLITGRNISLISGDAIEVITGDGELQKRVSLTVTVAEPDELEPAFPSLYVEDFLCLDEAARDKLGLKKWHKTELKIRKV